MCICVKNKESVAQFPYKSSQFQISIHGLRREELDLELTGRKLSEPENDTGLILISEFLQLISKVKLGHFCMVEENQFEVVVVRRVKKYSTVNN